MSGTRTKNRYTLNPFRLDFFAIAHDRQSNIARLSLCFIQPVQLALMIGIESRTFIHQHTFFSQQRIETTRQAIRHFHFAQEFPFLIVLYQLIRHPMKIEMPRHWMHIGFRFAISTRVFPLMSYLTDILARFPIKQETMGFTTCSIRYHNLVFQQFYFARSSDKRRVRSFQRNITDVLSQVGYFQLSQILECWQYINLPLHVLCAR